MLLLQSVTPFLHTLQFAPHVTNDTNYCMKAHNIIPVAEQNVSILFEESQPSVADGLVSVSARYNVAFVAQMRGCTVAHHHRSPHPLIVCNHPLATVIISIPLLCSAGVQVCGC